MFVSAGLFAGDTQYPSIVMRFTTIITLFNLIRVLDAVTAITGEATSSDHYLLSCGTDFTVPSASSYDGRTWYSDNNRTFSSSFSSTIAAKATITNLRQPLSTARFFTTNFTYTFPVSPGPKFIRLFFNPSPSPYSNPSTGLPLSSTEAYITVQANSDHILLRNFSAYLNFNSSQDPQYVVNKEFYVHVNNSVLQLTFSPSHPSSSYFINGIEVVSVPDNFYSGSIPPAIYVGLSTTFNLVATTALENTYRVNVGGRTLMDGSSTGSMYRSWMTDYPNPNYLVGYPGLSGDYRNTSTLIKYASWTPIYSAPTEVYLTFRSMGLISDPEKMKLNLTWRFEVDLEFNYLVRLYWCEVVVDVNHTGYRVFDVYMNGQMAEEAVDIYGWVGMDTAAFKDYVIYMGGDGSTSRGILELAMHPNINTQPRFYDVLLNGLEIFKINRSDGGLDAPNLSGPNPTPPMNQNPSPPQKSTSHLIPAIIGAIAGAILVAVLLSYLLILRRRKWSKMSAGSSGTASSKSKGLLSSAKSAGTTHRSSGGGSSLPSHLCRYFSLADIRIATSDFSDSLIVGHGGFGNVYKGTVNSDTGPISVAIKRLNPLSGQGAREFTTEIELLSKLRHLHLVSLIGYCDDCGEMILVYEFMSHGTLRDHLYPHNTNPNTQLLWCQRLEICVGAARGLHYLHTGTERMIIHRDVKSTNILLDEKWVAKVSDFGLSKLGPTGDEFSHVSTAVKGSFGYVDPEYYRRQQLTEKSDVYSFGVVLFEVLCGRTAVNPTLPKEQVNLRIWARRNQMSGTLESIVDPTLRGQIAPECLRKFGEVAESCVRDEGAQRPSMADVIWGLEFALQLQLEAAAKSTVNGDDSYVDEEVVTTNYIPSPTNDTTVRLIRSSGENTWNSINDTSSGLFSSTTSVGYGGGSTDVFSQIFKPEGR